MFNMDFGDSLMKLHKHNIQKKAFLSPVKIFVK